ncbi:hypothetical protein M758_1G098800 [Ceratodon purpureus]|nr:hypothetical protein M758_1G098800 [Ceratodon purpureus]
MAPSDQTEMPWTSSPIHIKGRLLEAFPTFRLSGLRVAIRGRMPVVEDHEVRYEAVAAGDGMWTEESDEDDDVVGDGSDDILEESLGAVIESVLGTRPALPVLPNPRFLARMASAEADDKSVPSSGENSPRIAMDADTEFHQVLLLGEIMPDDAGNTTRVGLAERE